VAAPPGPPPITRASYRSLKGSLLADRAPL
jgi:hypothetical protein